MAPVPGLTRKAMADEAKADLSPGCVVFSDALACFAGVTDAGCRRQPAIVGARKPENLPEFRWVNTIPGNLKTSLCGAYHAFDFAKYGTRYLAAFAYRCNRRFHLETLPRHLLPAVVIGPRPESWLRLAEISC